MALTLLSVRSSTPSRRIRFSSVRTICIASWLTGKTQWSLWTVRRTPSFSNQRINALWSRRRRQRFISCSPRGYTSLSELTASKLLVRLQRPPPVTATFARAFLPASKTTTSSSGCALRMRMEAKQPEAPAPMMAMRRLIFRKRLHCPRIRLPPPYSNARRGRTPSGRGSRLSGLPAAAH